MRFAIKAVIPVMAFSLAIVNIPPTSLAEASAKSSQDGIDFSIRSVRDGNWSDPETWKPARVPQDGDRVLVSRKTRVTYDVESEDVIRLVQVVGTLSFARDRDTLLNVGILKVQNSNVCSESGFACDFHDVNEAGEPVAPPQGHTPLLEIGSRRKPIPADQTARIRLHYVDGMNKNDAPAIACCSAQMEIHGSPMSRTWVDLGAPVEPDDRTVTLSEPVTGWEVGDEVIVTGSKRVASGHGIRRDDPEAVSTEQRRIESIEGRTIALDRALQHAHRGSGEYRSEVANLSRNVVIESADPDDVRGHTVYHRFSQGSISHARFAHLGKEGVLGRYSIHFHIVGNTMRGASVVGAAIVDSHNRWITVHGTNYMVVRDCVGYQSVGHGFFLEDGSEVYNVFDRNLGVQAYAAERLPEQVLPFDPNDGAAFWWANGRNTFVRNTACENHRYGFRYDSQNRSNFDSRLPVRMPDGDEETVDIRTIPFYRFEDNESHTEGLYSFAIAGTEGVGPDKRHPHVLKDLTAWRTHYALRAQVPTMWIENVDIFHAAYGIYRPYFDHHAYRNISMRHTEAEPFNRGLDDRSTQHGPITVDGLTFAGRRYGRNMPFIQISDNNPTGEAVSHFRDVTAPETSEEPFQNNVKPLVDRGGGRVVEPETPTSVPIYIHDYFGPDQDAKIVSTAANDFGRDDLEYRKQYPLTGDEARVARVSGVEFPKLLDRVDDLPPATVMTYPPAESTVRLEDGSLAVRGTTTDNTQTSRVLVNGVEAKTVDYNFHRWEAKLTDLKPGRLTITAVAEDAAGNREQTPHEVTVTLK